MAEQDQNAIAGPGAPPFAPPSVEQTGGGSSSLSAPSGAGTAFPDPEPGPAPHADRDVVAEYGAAHTGLLLTPEFDSELDPESGDEFEEPSLWAGGPYDPFDEDEEFPDDGTLAFDPLFSAGEEGDEGGRSASEGFASLSETYVPPVRPAWLDDPSQASPEQARSLFNGMAKLHEESAGWRAYERALGDPELSASTLRGEIDRAAAGFGMTAEEFGGLLFPASFAFSPEEDPFDDGSGYDPDEDDGADEDSDEGFDREAVAALLRQAAAEGDPFDDSSSDLDETSEEDGFEGDGLETAEQVAAALRRLGIEPEALRAQQEAVLVDGARRAFLSGEGAALAPEISARLDGFPVTPEMVMEARESAYLRYDDEAFGDPVLAVEVRFREELRGFRRGLRPGGPRGRAPSLARSAGSSPASPDFGATARDALRFLSENPDY